MICMVLAVLVVLVIFLDLSGRINLAGKAFMSLFLIIMSNLPFLLYTLTGYIAKWGISGLLKNFLIVEIIVFTVYMFLKVNIAPYRNKQLSGIRLVVLMGGRRLVLYSLYISFVQIFIYLLPKPQLLLRMPSSIFVLNIICTIILIAVLYLNGMLRIIFTSKRLNMIKKVTIASIMLIPILHILLIAYVCRAVKDQYEHECYRINKDNIRVSSQVCKTKYPIVLIHGFGFKDLKYINYWGRVPNELIKNGATIYYGNQEAWGTVEYNANDIKQKILGILNETGCEKVNIIAHSKGGLDARYMISKLDMGACVASLTMIGVPNHGSNIIRFIDRLPKCIYQTIGCNIDKYFRKIGDKNPDFFTSSRQLSVEYSKTFNEQINDDSRVYYQSYANVMKNMFSDYVLTVPYCILKIMDGENDGLVTVDSAKWGEFKGIIKNSHNRGISHGDIIDLRKNDYKGFDVREFYIQLVADLKNKGF